VDVNAFIDRVRRSVVIVTGTASGEEALLHRAGADGLLMETHNDPANALCDGEQCVVRDQLARIQQKAASVRHILIG